MNSQSGINFVTFFIDDTISRNWYTDKTWLILNQALHGWSSLGPLQPHQYPQPHQLLLSAQPCVSNCIRVKIEWGGGIFCSTVLDTHHRICVKIILMKWKPFSRGLWIQCTCLLKQSRDHLTLENVQSSGKLSWNGRMQCQCSGITAVLC